eukprot:630432-Rhodomonas_salina.1
MFQDVPERVVHSRSCGIVYDTVMESQIWFGILERSSKLTVSLVWQAVGAYPYTAVYILYGLEAKEAERELSKEVRRPQPPRQPRARAAAGGKREPDHQPSQPRPER